MTYVVAFKLFIKNKVLAIVSGVSLISLLLYLLKNFFEFSPINPDGYLSLLISTLETSVLCMIVFAFLSYEYFSKIKTSTMKECIESTKDGMKKLYFAQAGVMFLLDCILTILVLAYHVFAFFYFEMGHLEYLLHVVSNVFVEMFLVSAVAIMLGFFVSLFCKRLKAYLLLTVFIVLTSQIFENVAFTLFNTSGVNIYPAFEIFNLYSPALNWTPNSLFGVSILPYRLGLLCFWIFLLAAAALFKLSRTKKVFIKTASVFCALLCVGGLLVYLKPSSKYIMSNNPSQSLLNDLLYYLDNLQKEEEAAFGVTDYDLDVKIGDTLRVSAALQIDQPDLPDYKFTLYHGFRITAVKDQDGESMPFSQEGDYFTVQNSGGLTSLQISYSGYSPKFYSNTQGVCLPGYFPYYPHAGYKNVYYVDGQSFDPVLLNEPTPFTMDIKARYDVYSNLEQIDGGRYEGMTNGVTLLSGFVDLRTAENIEVVYPYSAPARINKEMIDQEIATFKESVGQGTSFKDIKKVLILPNINLGNTETVVLSDHVATRQMSEFSQRCSLALIPPYKRSLYSMVDRYLNDPGRHKEALEAEASNVEFVSDKRQPILLLTQKIEELGEEKTLREIDRYLSDDKDKREIFDFLTELR